MKREDLLKIVVIIGAVVMIGSMFAPAILTGSWSLKLSPKAEVATGITLFNGTIRTYEPILVVTDQIPDSLLAQLRMDERVKMVTSSSSGYLINVTARDEVYSLSQLLKANGIRPLTIANIIMPSSVDITLSNGSIVKASSSGTVQLWTEPLVDVDSEVQVRMTASETGGQLVNYQSPVLLAEKVAVSGNATITFLDGIEHEFIVPWEQRDQVKETSLRSSFGNSSVVYTRNDYVSFSPALSVQQIPEKKQLSYVTYISDTSASVASNFTDKSKVISDFGNTSVVFPDSGLEITTNESPGLPFNETVKYRYIISLPSQIDGYSPENSTLQISSGRKFGLNESVQIEINGTAIGKVIVETDNVKVG